jgi:hypothetical protein
LFKMQLKSLLVAAALLSNFASLTYGRAIDVPQSGELLHQDTILDVITNLSLIRYLHYEAS